MSFDKQKGVLHKIPFCIFYLYSIIHTKPVLYGFSMCRIIAGIYPYAALHSFPFLRTDMFYGYAKKYKKQEGLALWI